METKPRRKIARAIIGDDKVMPTIENHRAREHSSTSGEVSTARRSGRSGVGTPNPATITYYQNNQERMDYGRSRAANWPIGSGSVEGQRKFVVGRRFKGNGMRWRPHDNECVLRTRLAVLNGNLERYFQPRPELWNEAA